MLPFYSPYVDSFGKTPKIVLHEVTGLPVRYGRITRFHTSPSLKFSSFYYDKYFMINFINKTLDSFGEDISYRSYYENDFSWIIEWGMKPLEEIVGCYREVRTINLGRICARHAANAARDIFNNNDYNEEIDDWYNSQTDYTFPKISKSWCLIKIELSFNPFKNMYVIDTYMKRNLSEDYTPYYFISEKFLNDLNDIKANMVWNIRKNYLMLLEGLPLETGRNNILTYLLNDEIVKAVCEFMG